MPNTIDRSTIVRGPGSVTLGAVQMFDSEGIKAALKVDTFEVPVSAFGNVDTRRKDITAAITFRPCGALTAEILAALFPHGTPVIGASLLGVADVSCVIHSLAGTKVTFAAAALSKMPSLKLSAGAPAFSGEAEITCLLANDTDRTDADSLFVVAAEAWAGAFDVADILGGVYTGVLGTGETAVTIATQDGWQVDFEMEVEPQACDGVGTYDLLLKSVTVRAKCIPLGLTEATHLALLNAQDTGAVIGGTMRSGKDLVISCPDALTVTLKEAALVEGPMAWGNNQLRSGEIGFVAHRTVTGGVPAALFSVALTPVAP
ncbi:MAG: hypothetical protein R6X19_03370 [Kiritimatiellia bacterium]